MMRLLILMLCAFVSCTPETSPENESVSLSVDKNTLSFPAEGGEQGFTVTASEKLYLVPGDGWATVKKGSKSGNATTVTVTVAKNTTTSERSTRVSVVAGDEKQYVEISQAAAAASEDNGGQGGDNGGNDSDPQPVPDGSLPWQMAERLGIGWNLGNHLTPTTTVCPEKPSGVILRPPRPLSTNLRLPASRPSAYL